MEQEIVVARQETEDLAIKVPEGVPQISGGTSEQYASSCYVLLCPRPCGNTLITTFSNAVTDVQGFVARDSTRKEIHVVLDTQILLVPLVAPGAKTASGVRVHSGFLTAWDSVVLQVLTVVEVQKKLHPDYSIVTTGHSLGGSIALLAALTLKGTFSSTEVRAYSYGSPRVGNEAFAETLVHSNDGVPTMIPSKLGYHHHGVEYWQHSKPPSNATTVQCDTSGEDPRCSVSIPSRGINLAHTNYFGILVSTPFCL
ncbi:alpha/beta-hydrolase [Coprinellus micaceus]|uniref:Alpha/beta-hydrolase n=1 Tax=Coprinellus micaceus TaxID=71717 RepID=A0A4Y7TBH9_COPMI|nr:alpha/beta-hydrolase [Coprinellus micaceus]